MEDIALFLDQLKTDYPLKIVNNTNCFKIANSGRRGDVKEFLLTFSSVISSLTDINMNIDKFSVEYEESTWRNCANLLTDNVSKSLCGVQTRPFFETINKIVSWANHCDYCEGAIPLNKQNIDNTVKMLVKYYTHKSYFNINLANSDENIEANISSILKEFYAKYGTYGIHYFGLIYAKILLEKNIDISQLLESANLALSYSKELNKCRKIYEIALSRGDIRNEYKMDLGFLHNNNSFPSTFSPEQIIYYGVPGSGKSYKIDQKINAAYSDKNEREEHTMRVVFHPEYTNADFVGQIMPSINKDGVVEYKFTPGPFAQILRRAYLNPKEKYFLIIEEINRGNAAAIFGDIFQLLDRLGVNETDENYLQGWSKYSVNNDFINWYIREAVYKDTFVKIDTERVKKVGEEKFQAIEIGSLHFSANTGIRLPPNLSLFATMNTSDQNVFTLDNAFQRRWDMELVKNECTDETQNNAEIKVKEQSIIWKDFQQTINEYIGKMANESGLSSMEDKRLGCWFVKAENGEIKESVFVNKVLKYLWDDAFKFSRSEVFEGDIKTFEELQERFSEISFDIFRQECGLREKITEINKSQSNESNSQSTEPTTDSVNSQE